MPSATRGEAGRGIELVGRDEADDQAVLAVRSDARLERHARRRLGGPGPGGGSRRPGDLPPGDSVRPDATIAVRVGGSHALPQAAADVRVMERLEDAVGVAEEIHVVAAGTAPAIDEVVRRSCAAARERLDGAADAEA